jgi:hypothetical protein
VHHNIQIEYCWSYDERLHVIDTEKPKYERATRRACLTHLCDAPAEIVEAEQRLREAIRRAKEALRQHEEAQRQCGEYGRAKDAWQRSRKAVQRAKGAWQRSWKAGQRAKDAYRSLLDAVRAYLTPARKAKLLALLKRLTPDAPWNRKQLVFPGGKA